MKNFIYEQRILLDMSITTLSKILGISEEKILHWENGRSEPSIPEIIRLSQVFNISIDDLVKMLAEQKKGYLSEKMVLVKADNIVEKLKKKDKKKVILATVVLLGIMLSVFSLVSYSIKSDKYNRLYYAFTNFSSQEDFTFYEIYKGFKELGDFKDSDVIVLEFEKSMKIMIDFINQTYLSEFSKLSDIMLAANYMTGIQEYHPFSEEMHNDFNRALHWAGVWVKDSGGFSKSNPYNFILIDAFHNKVRAYVNENFYMEYLLEDIDNNHYVAYSSDSSPYFSLEFYEYDSIGFYFGDFYYGTFSRRD